MYLVHSTWLVTIIGGEATGDREATEMNPSVLGSPPHAVP